MVLDLIIDDDEGNRLVETKRGKLFRAPLEVEENMNELLVGEGEGEAPDESQSPPDDDEIDAMDHAIE